jgi:hypothetical protein
VVRPRCRSERRQRITSSQSRRKRLYTLQRRLHLASEGLTIPLTLGPHDRPLENAPGQVREPAAANGSNAASAGGPAAQQLSCVRRTPGQVHKVRHLHDATDVFVRSPRITVSEAEKREQARRREMKNRGGLGLQQ